MKALETLIRDGFVLVFNQNNLDVVETAKALRRAGINNMELTCRVNNSIEKLRDLKRELPDFMCGFASLVDSSKLSENAGIPSVDEAVKAGADYLVSASGFSTRVYEKYANVLPIIPGCATTSELVHQYELGANICKLFPAGVVGGAKFLKNIDPALHGVIPVMPTGGTSGENIPDYIEAGCLLLGASFSMFNQSVVQTAIENHDYAMLSEEFRKVKSLIDQCRSEVHPQLDFKTDSLETISEFTGRHFNQERVQEVCYAS